MAAMLIEIKSRMLLPPKKSADGEEAEDPRAELVRRLLEYEQMKLAAARLDALPLLGRDFLRAQVHDRADRSQPRLPDVDAADLRDAWLDILQARQAQPAPQDHARAAVGARAHEHRAAHACRAGASSSSRTCSTRRAACRWWWSPSSRCSSWRASACSRSRRPRPSRRSTCGWRTSRRRGRRAAAGCRRSDRQRTASLNAIIARSLFGSTGLISRWKSCSARFVFVAAHACCR